MSNSIEESLVLDFLTLVVRLLVLELLDGAQPLHRPVGQLPRFRPPDVHGLRANYHHDQVDAVHADRGAQAGARSWRHARLDSVDAALPQHQVRVVPLVRPFVPIRVFFHCEELRAHQFLELRDLHGSCAQLGNVQGSRFVVVVRKAVR